QTFGLEENFEENGIADIEGFDVVVVPTPIAEKHKELVGLGDIISSGSFFYETV
ncbi:MAG: hypothetical protein ABEJ72_10570, partial [Candidatus Aenigmatarchaeota archaeon]